MSLQFNQIQEVNHSLESKIEAIKNDVQNQSNQSMLSFKFDEKALDLMEAEQADQAMQEKN